MNGPKPKRSTVHLQRSTFNPAPLNVERWTLNVERWIALVLLFAFLSTFSLTAATPLSTNLPPITASLPDASFSVIRVFGALMLVLALFLAGVWLFKNWQRLTVQRGRPSQLQLLEMRALGGKHVLYVVGYQQQRMLLAASPAGVTLVSHLPAADATELEPAQVAPENFVHALQQAVQGKT
jgi:flagellar biogenesis protein FliO